MFVKGAVIDLCRKKLCYGPSYLIFIKLYDFKSQENNCLVLCPEFMGNCLSQFFGSMKIHGNPLLDVFTFLESYFFSWSCNS